MIDKLLKVVVEKQRALEYSIFKTPPPNMEAFKEKLGRWLELEETKAWLINERRAVDEDEDES